MYQSHGDSALRNHAFKAQRSWLWGHRASCLVAYLALAGRDTCPTPQVRTPDGFVLWRTGSLCYLFVA
jgi:hypothetical protein